MTYTDRRHSTENAQRLATVAVGDRVQFWTERGWGNGFTTEAEVTKLTPNSIYAHSSIYGDFRLPRDPELRYKRKLTFVRTKAEHEALVAERTAQVERSHLEGYQRQRDELVRKLQRQGIDKAIAGLIVAHQTEFDQLKLRYNHELATANQEELDRLERLAAGGTR